MNKQGKIINGKVVGIEWTKTFLPDGTERQGYTWNPIAGCFHACAWTMPDGTIANCYAEDIAERIAGAAYPHGFEHHYWKQWTLKEPLDQKKPSKIFVGSMADVFGHWVPEEQIEQIFDICSQARQHTFQFLTKNPRRVKKFIGFIPANCWIGASTPPDFIWNKPLAKEQRVRWLYAVLATLSDLHELGIKTWLSAEPLTIDVQLYLNNMKTVPIDWMVIGAASNGSKYYPPSEEFVKGAVAYNKRYAVKTFFKGNLKTLPWAAANWHEEFPS
jgi:protein gp37